MMIEKPGLTLYGLFIVMVLLAAAALLLGVAVSSILVLLLIYAALAYSINFITGMICYVDFGHVLFMAIGSYALATLVSYYGANPLLGVGLGALLGLVFALGIGLVILRFRGVYFAIATVVLVLAAYNLVLQFPQLGPGGEIIFNLTFQPLATYFTIWTIVLIEIVLTYYVNKSRIGFGIRAIKNEEDAASSVGVGPQTLKLTGYMLGGLFGGAAGAVYAWSISGVTAGPAFDFTFSLLMLAMIIIGGVGTSIGRTPKVSAGVGMPILQASSISKNFGGVQALKDISFDLPESAVLGLIGPNGSGKSTLLNIIAGLEKPTSGILKLDSQRIDNLQANRVVGYGLAKTHQIPKPFSNMTARENVAVAVLFGRRNIHSPSLALQEAEKVLSLVGMRSRNDAPAGSLTVQEKKRLELARVIAD